MAASYRQYARMGVLALPYISDWFAALPAVYIVFIGIAALFVVLTYILTIRLVYTVHYCVPNEFIQSDFYFIVLIPSVVSTMCLLGNIMPRCSQLLYAFGLIYLMICLHITIVLITRVFGTKKDVVKWLIDNNKVLHFNVRPYCCCCQCLPVVRPSPKSMRRLGYMVRQSPIVRVILQIGIILLVLEGNKEGGVAVWTLNILGVISTILAIYGCQIIVRATMDGLIPYNMHIIYRCVETSQMLYTFQKFILDVIAFSGGMGGLSMAPPSMVSRFWHNTAMTIWLFLIAIAMVRNIRPGKTLFFAEKKRSNGNIVPLTDIHIIDTNSSSSTSY